MCVFNSAPYLVVYSRQAKGIFQYDVASHEEQAYRVVIVVVVERIELLLLFALISIEICFVCV